MKGLAEVFGKRVSGPILKKITELAARQGFKQIFKSLGAKGAAEAALATGIIADDATVIGVADDLLLIPLGLWMSKDIYDIYDLIKNAKKMEKEIAARHNLPIRFFRIKDGASRKALQEKLTPHGLDVDHLEELDQETLFALLKEIPSTEIDILREGMTGRERWTLEHGNITHTAILDDELKIICEMDNDDIEKMDDALGKVESAEKSKTTPLVVAELPGHTATPGHRGSM